jgi:putative NIF3 family GTP cyclohydrolase 1 type 2
MNFTPSLTRLVQELMQKLYPLEFADRSWDNVGLLLEPPPQCRHVKTRPTVMLTTDLTTSVADEALDYDGSGIETIVTYRLSQIYPC